MDTQCLPGPRIVTHHSLDELRWPVSRQGGGSPSIRYQYPLWSVTVEQPLTIRACARTRSEEHTSELQSHSDLVCRLLLEKKKKQQKKKKERKTKDEIQETIIHQEK